MTSAARKLSRLIRHNKRYAPLLDTALKTSPLFAVAGVFVGTLFWGLFNAYLGQLDQPPLPADQAAQWIFLPVLGFVVVVLMAGIIVLPATWTPAVRWNAPPAISDKAIRQGCFATAFTTCVFTGLAIYQGTAWVPFYICVAIAVGGLAGGLVSTRFLPPYGRITGSCAGFAGSTMVLMLWISSVWLLLAPAFEPLLLVSRSWRPLDWHSRFLPCSPFLLPNRNSAFCSRV